jgi:cytochrome c553
MVEVLLCARLLIVSSAAALASIAFAADAGKKQPPPPDPQAFDRSVRPVLGKVCSACHNQQTAAGGLDIAPFLRPESVLDNREEWEKILHKVRAGEMPPKGVARPAQADIERLQQFVEGIYEKIDQSRPQDPGRIVARRLNRAEYANTIRDLLGVEFAARQQFPTDDLGYGFDNIGSVLTISPLLMERYVAAAEQIASRALGADPLPKKPLEVQYHNKDKKIRRIDFSNIEVTHNVEWEAEYIVRFGLPGERAKDAKPVTLGFWMDGKLLKTKPVETKPSGLVYFDPYSEEEMRLMLPEGDHVFRAGFINDDAIKDISPKDAYNRKKNKFLDSITFIGPFPSTVERASRKQILICDPATGAVCVDRILSTLARRAYRRPVTRREVASLDHFVQVSKAEGQSVEQGIQLAIEAMLVSPHFLFRIERDPGPDVHPISDVELASRLSYFLWSSMPDEELLRLAESGKLHNPATLDQQITRMLADPRSSALGENFGGQWLEIRNLDTITPDPKKFPTWTPDLRDAMKAETRLFFDSVLRENRPISDFLDADYTFLNERLAKHYGIEGVRGPDFRRVELKDAQRGGLLSQASVLTVSSYATRTSVVLRGKYILSNFLGAPPPPAPPDVPQLNEATIGATDSLRTQMEKHRSNPACATCHAKMDVLGFGLENYDAVGHWRTMDGKFPVDSSGTLPNGATFATPAELRKLLLADLPEFTRCLTEKMLTYALGRGLDRRDAVAVASIAKKVEASGYGFQTLIHEVAKSYPFDMGRGEPPAAKPMKKEVAHK